MCIILIRHNKSESDLYLYIETSLKLAFKTNFLWMSVVNSQKLFCIKKKAFNNSIKAFC